MDELPSNERWYGTNGQSIYVGASVAQRVPRKVRKLLNAAHLVLDRIGVVAER